MLAETAKTPGYTLLLTLLALSCRCKRRPNSCHSSRLKRHISFGKARSW